VTFIVKARAVGRAKMFKHPPFHLLTLSLPPPGESGVRGLLIMINKIAPKVNPGLERAVQAYLLKSSLK
jgi:hypothetical protein